METRSMAPQRLRLGLWVLAILPVLSYANFFWQNAPQPPRHDAGLMARVALPPAEDWGVYGERFRSSRAFLPTRGVVGLVCDEKDDLFLLRLYSAQFALAPLVLRPDARAQKVLCLFRDSARLRDVQQRKVLSRWTELDGSKQEMKSGFYTPVARRVQASTPLVLERDFGNGLMLFHRVSGRISKSRSTP